MALSGIVAPAEYRSLLQEDRIVEWATVWFFLIAGVAGVVRSGRERRLFDGLVALFCIFVAAEELSWGQRLLGYSPSEFFLANNVQQEANFHNLPQSILQPKWFLMAALGGYGVVLPLAAATRRGSARLSRFGATAPPLALIPWFAAAIVLLVWYPLTLTGEWVEALAGGLFLVASGVFPTAQWLALGAAVVLAMTTMRAADVLQSGRDGERRACARSEVQTFVSDIADGSAGTRDLWEMNRVHKRIWSSGQDGYLHHLHADGLRSARHSDCDVTTDRDLRDKYAIDPWGSPYWLLVERLNDADHRVTVYSFGPNRRRDLWETAASHGAVGDDVVASAVRSAPPNGDHEFSASHRR